MPRGRRWYDFARHTFRIVIFVPLGGFRSIDSQKVPAEGPVILAPVHFSNFDPPAVAAGTSRRVEMMAKAALFKVPILGPIIRSLGAFPVRKGAGGDAESVRHAIKVLQEGKALMMFPEGTRGDGKTVGESSKGLGMLAKMTKAQVVPVAIIGTNIVLPRGASRPRRARVTVRYGDPMTFEQCTANAEGKDKQTVFAGELRRRLLALCADGGLILKTSSDQEGSREPSDPPLPPAQTTQPSP